MPWTFSFLKTNLSLSSLAGDAVTFRPTGRLETCDISYIHGISCVGALGSLLIRIDLYASKPMEKQALGEFL